MMCKVGEVVLYRGEVCRATGIAEKNMSGVRAEYYVLKPVYDENTTVYAPVNGKATAANMRRVLSVGEAKALVKAMPAEETIWIDNEAARRERYREILAGGDRAGLVRLIKTLYLHGKSQKERGRKTHSMDERFMKDAEKMLYGELAYVLNIGREAVPPFIMEQLQGAAPLS